MIEKIITLIGGLLQVAGRIFDWLYARQMVNAARTAERLQALREQVDAAKKAVEVRIAVERSIASDIDQLRSDDGFRRADDE